MANPLTPPTRIPPALDPLAESPSPDQIEEDLNDAFIEVFEAMLRQAERRINAYGTPHRGSFQVIERFVKADGLAMERRSAAEAFMAHLFRAWRAGNPRRGTQFLRFYLQLLWPGQWSLVQLWHEPAATYPEGLVDSPGPGRWLTSRVRLDLEIDQDDGDELTKLAGSFRSVLPARLLLDMSILTRAAANDLRLASAGFDVEWESFEGTVAPGA